MLKFKSETKNKIFVAVEKNTAEISGIDNIENHTCKREYDYIGPDNIITELQNNLDIEHTAKNVCADDSQYYSYTNLS